MFVITVLQDLFKKEIEFMLTNMLYKQLTETSTLKANAFIQKYYPDNFEFLPNLFSFNLLLTYPIRVEKNFMTINLFGDLIDLNQNYQITEETTTIKNFDTNNINGIQILITNRIIHQFLVNVLSLPQYSSFTQTIVKIKYLQWFTKEISVLN